MTMLTMKLKKGDSSVTPDRLVATSDSVQVLVNDTALFPVKPTGKWDGEEMRKKSMAINGFLVLGVPALWWNGDENVMEFWPVASRDFAIII